MFEHVGRKNYDHYFEIIKRNLATGGLFLLHTIGCNGNDPGIDPWVTKYIFPNSEIPNLPRILQGLKRRFMVEDLHNFGADYARTLLAWHENFTRAWPQHASQMRRPFPDFGAITSCFLPVSFGHVVSLYGNSCFPPMASWAAIGDHCSDAHDTARSRP